MDHVEDLIADGAMAFFALDEQGGKLFSQITTASASKTPSRLHKIPAVRPGAWYSRTIWCSPAGILAPRKDVLTRNRFVFRPSTFNTKFSSYGMLVMRYPSFSTETTPEMPSPPYVFVVPPINVSFC